MSLPEQYIRIYHSRGGGYMVCLHTPADEIVETFPEAPSEIIDDVAKWPDLPVVCRLEVADDLGALGFDPDDTRIIVIR